MVRIPGYDRLYESMVRGFSFAVYHIHLTAELDKKKSSTRKRQLVNKGQSVVDKMVSYKFKDTKEGDMYFFRRSTRRYHCVIFACVYMYGTLLSSQASSRSSAGELRLFQIISRRAAVHRFLSYEH